MQLCGIVASGPAEPVSAAAQVLVALRGWPADLRSVGLDREALRLLILRFALLIREAPEGVAAGLNSVRCMAGGCVALEVRLRSEHVRRFEGVKTW
jgi:hypothetical protein